MVCVQTALGALRNTLLNRYNKKEDPISRCLCQGGMEMLLKKAVLSLISIISMHGEKNFTVKQNSRILL